MASYRLNRPIFMGNFNNAFSLPCGITLNVDYRYQSKGNTMNVYLAKEQHVLDVSISKSFLKDALTLEIKGNDLLYKCWDADLLYNQQMELLQVSKRGTRDLQLTLRYKFNTTRSKYKGTGACYTSFYSRLGKFLRNLFPMNTCGKSVPVSTSVKLAVK